MDMPSYGEIGIIMFRMPLMSESALDIVRSETLPNYYNDLERVFTETCIYCYFSVINLHFLHIARVETKNRCCFAI